MSDIEEILQNFIVKLVIDEPLRKEFFKNREKIFIEYGRNLTTEQKTLLTKIKQEDFEVYLKKENNKTSIIGHCTPVGKPPGSIF